MAIKGLASSFKGLFGVNRTNMPNNKASKTIRRDPTCNTTGTGNGTGTNKAVATTKSRKKKRRTLSNSTPKSAGWETSIAVLQQRMSSLSPKKRLHKPASTRNLAKSKSAPADKYFVMDDISILSGLDAKKLNGGKRVTMTEASQHDGDGESFTSSSEEDDCRSIASEGSFEVLIRHLTCSVEKAIGLSAVEDWDDDDPVEIRQAVKDHKRRDMMELLLEGLCF